VDRRPAIRRAIRWSSIFAGQGPVDGRSV